MQALSPNGEEANNDLIYLNDAYKRAIIDLQGQKKVRGMWTIFLSAMDMV